MAIVCDKEEHPTEYDWTEDVDHVSECLTDAQNALDALWRLVEPLLARSATRNTGATAKWSYYQVFDALKHSVGWLQAMPRRASDGTSVWLEDQPPAVTNEVRGSDGLEGNEESHDAEPRGREERDSRSDHVDAWPRGKGPIKVRAGDTVSRQETPEQARTRKARDEERRLAKLRTPPRRRKATKKR